MSSVLAALAALAVGGVLAALLSRWPKAATVAGAGACVIAACLALPEILLALSRGPSDFVAITHPWDVVPGAAFSVRLDVLSGFFLLLVFAVSAVIAVFSGPYFLQCRARRPVGLVWLWFNLLVAGMGVTILAANVVLFLVAWEIMSLAAWFLVALDDQREDVKNASWTYLVSAHLGAAFLIGLYALLGSTAGALELGGVSLASSPQSIKNVVFLLALIGFGTKAGVWPLHVWLPDTYAAAPGPIPALLSGVMSKVGLYGLLRILSMLGPPQAWWGGLLIGLGAAGAIFGILQALGQHDLKRVLACSSIENVGIILLGLGVGLLGLSTSQRGVALLGLGGALFHILNHSLCKSLLFLGSAAIEQGAGSLELDQLGGLMKRTPVLGCTFLVGSAAISALPPFNSFASEFLIYLGAFEQSAFLPPVDAILPLVVLGALALAGGLAVACFTRAFSVIFLGTPRSEISEPKQVGWGLLFSLVLLAAACTAVGFAAPAVADRLVPVLSLVSGIPYAETEDLFLLKSRPLFDVAFVMGTFLVLLAVLVVLRWRLLRGREVTESETWGCGYTRPTPRIQYTASSYAQPLLELFAPLLGWQRRKPVFTRYFPSGGEGEQMTTSAHDMAVKAGYRPIFTGVAAVLGWLHILQAGRVQIYVLYIVLTLLVLLVAALGGGAP